MDKIVKILKNDGIGVLPTDTIYGLVGRVLSRKATKKIFKIKKRSANKPFIILISSFNDLTKIGVKIDNKTKQELKKIWPGPVSVAFSPKISARWPKNKFLNELVKKTGPLVAPSANPEGLPPAKTLSEARNYFGNTVDFYLKASHRLKSLPSTLIQFKHGKIEVLRQGQKIIKQ